MKKQQPEQVRQPLVFVTTSELEFKPLQVLRSHGFPNEFDDFLRLLPTKVPDYEIIDEYGDRVDRLFDEIDFQITRLQERTDDSEVKLSISEFARILAEKVEEKNAKLGRPLSRKIAREFVMPDDVEYKRKDDTLPSGVDPTQVLKQVLFLSPFKFYFHKNENFKLLMYSPLHASIISDIFWWIFLELFQKQREETNFLQTRLTISIARRLKEMQQRMEHHQKGLFAKHYSETLGKCIYVGFLESFPYQAQMFGNRFKQLLMANICRWSSTMPPPPRYLRAWDLWPLVSHNVFYVLQEVLRPSVDVADLVYDSAAFESEVSRFKREDRKYSEFSHLGMSREKAKMSIRNLPRFDARMMASFANIKPI